MDWCQENIGLGQMEAGSAAEREVSNKVKAMEDEAEAEKAKKANQVIQSRPCSHLPLFPPLSPHTSSPCSIPPPTPTSRQSISRKCSIPMTPDNPNVKYFSIAGRCEGVNVWHPLWLPKLVLDGYESKLRKGSESPSRRNPDWQWGNDCLVSIESAKWGEFLGVLEGCDHWAMRGASVLDLNYDFSSVSASIPSLSSIGIGGGNGKEGDWSLKRLGKVRQAVEDGGNETDGVQSEAVSAAIERDGLSVDDVKERENALKTSTDKVSAMLDWIVDQVPLTSKEKGEMSAAGKEASRKRDIASKEGLERLYVALSKKLYDEGL
jgi:triacylglycerol lipase